MHERLKDERLVVSVSGGKDSTAMCLHLFENGYTKDDFDRVFMDTGWEAQTTYAYLDELESTVGKIIRLKLNVQVKKEDEKLVQHYEDRLGFESPFLRLVFQYNSFPSNIVKWCTRRLKIEPIKKYYESLDYDFVNVVGIRREESKRREQMVELEWNDGFDCYVWRPLINWTVEEVIKIHQRFGLRPNNLYLNGFQRVGCYPCINSNKKEIKHLSKERIALIRDLENVITQRRETLNKSTATFFKKTKIDDAVSWSNTSYGGKQFELFDVSEPTCVKWGMCGI
jgi:3'-phosphoadenosine 5'-phosphosulfate sulfotransferase (PAPS reductase)/FAD synthetase